MAGSIQHRPSRPKPWLARYRAPDGRERSKAFVRKIDAGRWLRSELTTLDRGAWVDPHAGGVNLDEWTKSWLAALHGVKPKTKVGYASLLRSRVLPTFGSHQLRQITTASVRQWQAEMLDDGLSPARVRQARQVLHATLEQAVSDGILPGNPTDRVKAPTVRPRRQRFLTATEVEQLAKAADERQSGAVQLVRFLAYSGLRWGEAVALRRSAVDAERRRVHVREAATEIGGRLEFGSPKTHEARTVILPRFLIDDLRALTAGKGLGDLVFTAPRGGPLRSSNFRRDVWLPAVDDAGLASDLVPHDLRDTAASLMISAGASIKAVQRALGHASAKMTLDTYGSLFEEDLEDLADRLDERFGTVRADHRGTKDTEE